jgi:hypothetical protein
MSCGGGHLGFPIGIKNTHFVEQDLVNIGPYGKNVSKRFFSETTWTIETKLPRNDHWKVLDKFFVFYADRKSKMAATTGHSRNIFHIGSNVKLSPAVAAILNFISDQKT